MKHEPVSSHNIVRAALKAWAESLMADVAPPVCVVGETAEGEGEAVSLPTLGIGWGQVDEFEAVPAVEDIYDDEDPAMPARGVWRLHYEDAQVRFSWNASSAESADLFAHVFFTRAKVAAAKSNPEGSPVLHIRVSFAGVERTCKLYFDGKTVPETTENSLLRGLYTFGVTGTVTYPVMHIEDPGMGFATGRMSVVVDVDGVLTSLDDLEEES